MLLNPIHVDQTNGPESILNNLLLHDAYMKIFNTVNTPKDEVPIYVLLTCTVGRASEN